MTSMSQTVVSPRRQATASANLPLSSRRRRWVRRHRVLSVVARRGDPAHPGVVVARLRAQRSWPGERRPGAVRRMAPGSRWCVVRQVGGEHLVLPSRSTGGRETRQRGDSSRPVRHDVPPHRRRAPTPAHLALPAPIAPIASPPVAGEGQWHPAGRRVHGLSAVYEAFLRPDAVHTSVVTGVAWMDTKLLSATLYSGSTIPGGGPWHDTAPVSPRAATTLVSRVQRRLLDVERPGWVLHARTDRASASRRSGLLRHLR